MIADRKQGDRRDQDARNQKDPRADGRPEGIAMKPFFRSSIGQWRRYQAGNDGAPQDIFDKEKDDPGRRCAHHFSEADLLRPLFGEERNQAV